RDGLLAVHQLGARVVEQRLRLVGRQRLLARAARLAREVGDQRVTRLRGEAGREPPGRRVRGVEAPVPGGGGGPEETEEQGRQRRSTARAPSNETGTDTSSRAYFLPFFFLSFADFAGVGAGAGAGAGSSFGAAATSALSFTPSSAPFGRPGSTAAVP